MTTHTILLIQLTPSRSSRTFCDFETLNLALEEIIRQYETKLKDLNPTVRNISYDMKDLNTYIDSMGDLCALCFDERTKQYQPHDRQWIKSKIYAMLSKSARN